MEAEIVPGTGDAGAVTIYEVAQRAGVSIATVSRALKKPELVAPATRARVQQVIEELNYLPDGAAMSLAAGRQEAHGLILPELTGLYYADLVAGYESTVGDLDQSLIVVLARGKDDIAHAARRLATRVDGMAIMGSAGLPEELVQSLAARLPVVIAAGAGFPGAEVVRAENVTPARELTGLLLDSGRRRLLFVGDPSEAVDVRQRYAGFVAAHEDRGRTADEPVRVAFTEEAGAEVAEHVLARRPRPDGLFCANDLLAIVLVDRLLSAGLRLPRDMAVTGWDDVMAARYLRPRLTTVRQPVRELAATIAHRLHDRVAGLVDDAHWGRTHTLPTQVVVRDSCGTASSTSEKEGKQL